MPTGHTPPGATLWPKGAPHLRPHRGGGPSPTGHLWPPPPSLATYWPPTGHPGGPGPTGHLRPTWLSEAFGHLRTHSPHRPIVAFGREASTPTDWPKGLPDWPHTGHPQHSPTPRLSGAVAKGRGRGFSRAKGADTMVPVCPIPPLGPPTPTDLPDWHPTGTGLPPPHWHLPPLTD